MLVKDPFIQEVIVTVFNTQTIVMLIKIR